MFLPFFGVSEKNTLIFVDISKKKLENCNGNIDHK